MSIYIKVPLFVAAVVYIYLQYIYLSVYVATYLSQKQNKRTLEIQNIEPYTPTSNLSFFTMLLKYGSQQCFSRFWKVRPLDLTWLYHVKKKDNICIVSTGARRYDFSSKSRKLVSESWKAEWWEKKSSEVNQNTEEFISKYMRMPNWPD